MSQPGFEKKQQKLSHTDPYCGKDCVFSQVVQTRSLSSVYFYKHYKVVFYPCGHGDLDHEHKMYSRCVQCRQQDEMVDYMADQWRKRE